MPVWVPVLLVMMATGVTAYEVNSQQGASNQVAGRQSMGQNLALYVDSVSSYATINPAYSGTVSDVSLGLPSWFTKHPDLHHVIENGRAFVYIVPSPAMRSIGDVLAGAPTLNPKKIGTARQGKLWSPIEAAPIHDLPNVVPSNAIVYAM